MFYASSVALRKNKSRIYNESKRRKCDWIYQKRVQEIVAVFTSNQEERVAMKTAMMLSLLALTVRWWRLELGHDSWLMSTNKKERHIVLPHGHGSEMSALEKKREFLSTNKKVKAIIFTTFMVVKWVQWDFQKTINLTLPYCPNNEICKYWDFK